MELIVGFKTADGFDAPEIYSVQTCGLQYIYESLNLKPYHGDIPGFGFALRRPVNGVPGDVLTYIDKAVELAHSEAQMQYGTLRSFRYEITGPYVCPDTIDQNECPVLYMLIVGDCEPLDPSRKNGFNIITTKVIIPSPPDTEALERAYYRMSPNASQLGQVAEEKYPQ